METLKVKVMMVCCCFLFVTSQSLAQEAQTPMETQKKNVAVQKYTFMERFEPEFATVEERIELKEKRIEEINRTKELLDTLDISDRKRKKLLEDLQESPFSQRLSKAMAENSFEDEE